MILYII